MSEIKVNKISPRTDCGTTTLGDSGDSITVAGDLKSNSLKATDGGVIISQSGTAITLGASGDTVSLASGASQSGFGRTGTVDWQTGSIKTTGFTAVSGNGYFVNTTSGGVTATLPASPSAGDIVAIADYAGTAASNNITIGRNSSKIESLTDDAVINVNREAKTLVYVDGTQGWVPVNDNADAISEIKFVTASGGNCTTTSGNYKIHTFTGPGTFTVSCAGNGAGSNTVDYLVVAGGGGAGSDRAGGGGAGGYRESSGAASGCYSRSPLGACVSALPVSAQGYPIVVGGGGAGKPAATTAGSAGNNSSFSSITSAGGGGGGVQSDVGSTGGSGGGGAGIANPANAGQAGNTPPVSPPQGNNGGNGNGTESGPKSRAAGGGGGATAVGTTGTPSQNGCGGAGATSSITGSPVARAGGGAGGTSSTPTGPASGGTGGGAPATGPNGTNGTTNTGGGGSGGAGCAPGTGGSGGSGVVIIRYKYQ